MDIIAWDIKLKLLTLTSQNLYISLWFLNFILNNFKLTAEIACIISMKIDTTKNCSKHKCKRFCYCVAIITN